MGRNEQELLRGHRGQCRLPRGVRQGIPGRRRLAVDCRAGAGDLSNAPSCRHSRRSTAGSAAIEAAISNSAKRGFDLFTGRAGCAECHTSWRFTDDSFRDIGTGGEQDLGRGRLFPNSQALQHAFKVPTLRDVARRAPYMHDGSLPTLAAVVALYDRGGVARPSQSELIHPLRLANQERDDLLAFLQTLTGDAARDPAPVIPAR